jgi:predicted transcriptional regulator YheO
MRYKKDHTDRLHAECCERFHKLMDVFQRQPSERVQGIMCLNVNGSELRLAVDDFKNVLAEIRRMK